MPQVCGPFDYAARVAQMRFGPEIETGRHESLRREHRSSHDRNVRTTSEQIPCDGVTLEPSRRAAFVHTIINISQKLSGFFRKRGKTRGGMIIRFRWWRESDS